MTYDELFKEVSLRQSVTNALAKEIIRETFSVIKENVLTGDGRNCIPQFGTFVQRRTKAAVRPVMGVPTKVPASTRVVFRVSSGAKSSE